MSAHMAREFLENAPLHTRVVVRYMLPDGRATDALGPLRERTRATVTVDTVRGLAVIGLVTVIRAKAVPPPPPRRPRRTSYDPIGG